MYVNSVRVKGLDSEVMRAHTVGVIRVQVLETVVGFLLDVQ